MWPIRFRSPRAAPFPPFSPGHGRPPRTYRYSVGLLCLLWGLFVGCRTQEADLLQLDHVGPGVIQPGTEISITGRGFPTGRQGVLTLEGHTFRPGTAPLEVQHPMHARAVTETRAVARISSDTLRNLGDRGTFHGLARLAFVSDGGGVEVGGTRPEIELDLLSTSVTAVPRSSQRHSARKLLHYLGLTVNEGESSMDGLRVQSARQDSVAARAGLVQGDRIVKASNVVVHSVGDLAAPPGAQNLALWVRRPHRTHPVAINLPIGGLKVPTLSRIWTPATILAVALLWFLAFYGPFNSPSLWVARMQSRLRHASPVLSPRMATPRSKQGALTQLASPNHSTRSRSAVSSRWQRLALPMSACILFCAAMFETKFRLKFNSLQAYLGLTAVVLWLSLINRDGQAAPTVRERLSAGKRPLGQLAIVMLVVGSACALSGTRSLSGIVESQGFWPTRWGVFTQPALFLLFPVFVMIESSAYPAVVGGSDGSRTGIQLAQALGRLVLCGTGSAVFLGGWAHQDLHVLTNIQAQTLGAALFVAKTGFVAALLRTAQNLSLGHQRSPIFIPTMLAAALALTGLWVLSGAGQELRLFFGTVLASAAALIALTATVKVLRTTAPMASTPVHPAPFRT